MKPSATIVSKLYVSRGRAYAFGPGKADLLENIKKLGSIAEAAKAMEMSYMRAWQLVKGMNRGWSEPLVVTARGGAGRGGASVSPTGEKVLTLYRQTQDSVEKAALPLAKKFASLLR